MAGSQANVISLFQGRGAASASWAVAREPESSVQQPNLPAWEPAFRSRMGKLLALKDGWDNASAKAIDPFVADFADAFLHYLWPIDGPTPFVAPTCYGGVQLEWRLPSFEFEIEIIRRHFVSVLAVDHDNDTEVEFTCQHDLTDLFRLVSEFFLRLESVQNAATAA